MTKKFTNRSDDIAWVLDHIARLAKAGSSMGTIMYSARVLCNKYSVDFDLIQQMLIEAKENVNV